MKKFMLLSFLFCALIAGQAYAAVVDFDDAYSNEYLPGTSVSISGLTFTNYSGEGLMYIYDSSSPNSNGTNNLIFGFKTSDLLVITKTGGGTFDLNNVDMSLSWYTESHPSDTVFINGSPVTLFQGIQNYALNLQGVTQVAITGIASGSGYWLMDNVNYGASSVPLPAGLLLLGPGLAGLAVLRRRLKK